MVLRRSTRGVLMCFTQPCRLHGSRGLRMHRPGMRRLTSTDDQQEPGIARIQTFIRMLARPVSTSPSTCRPGHSHRRARQSAPGRLRCCLISERRRFPASRRRREPLVGRVGRRTGSGTRASRRSVARRCLAAVRLRRCGYWLSLAGWPGTANTSTVTVTIPRTQVLDTAQLRALMERADREEAL